MPVDLVRLREAILNNKGLKSAALLLAIAAWYAIGKMTSAEMWIRNVPINIKVESGWAILDRSATTADVLFRGAQQDLAKMQREYTEVRLEIRTPLPEGAARVTLTPRNVKSLGGARAVEIRPAEITLQLDQEVEAQIPVKVEWTSEPPPGYELEKVVCTPAAVTLYGPRRRLKEVERVRTAPLDLKGRSTSFETRLPIQPPSDRWVARMEPDSVKVDVTLVERSDTRELQEVRVRALVSPDLAPRVKVWPNKVSVALRGRSDLVERLQPEDVRGYVDCDGLAPAANYDLPVSLHAPAGILVERIEPATVRVELSEH